MSIEKIIIHHGDRVTEHEIGDRPLVIGRDPECDLFFADRKLSRRHARFEPDGGQLRLVDLGSRNGSWVNDVQVEERLLAREDSVRLGGLEITLEFTRDEAPSEESESTVVLSAGPSPDDSHTVVLPAEAVPPAVSIGSDAAQPRGEAYEDTGTVMLPTSAPSQPPSDEDPTVHRPPGGDAKPTDRTVVLPDEPPGQDRDTGTVIFQETEGPPPEATRPVANAGARAEIAADASEVSFASVVASGAGIGDKGKVFRFVLLVAATAALAVVVLALPLSRTLGRALTEESTLRGRALVDLLAATNERALRENRTEALSLARIAGEPRVVAAFILDPAGRVLAPRDSTEAASTIEELGGDLASVRTFRRNEAANGDVVLIKPILGEGRRLGLAILRYRATTASGWTTMMMFLGWLLLLMGVAFAVLLVRRWTLLPLLGLRDDVQAVRAGYVGTLPEDRPYTELSEIARSFNELLRQQGKAGTESRERSAEPGTGEDPTVLSGGRGRSDPYR